MWQWRSRWEKQVVVAVVCVCVWGVVGGGGESLPQCSSHTVCFNSVAWQMQWGGGSLALDCLSFDVSSGTNKPIKLQRDKWGAEGWRIGRGGGRQEGEEAGGDRRWFLKLNFLNWNLGCNLKLAICTRSRDHFADNGMLWLDTWKKRQNVKYL